MVSKTELEQIRKRMMAVNNRRQVDPNEFVPPKVADGDTIEFKYYFLPGLRAGDKVFGGGVASLDMDMFFIKNGMHWVNKRPYACPRIINDEDCDMCTVGFELMKEIEGKDEAAKKRRSVIAKQWLSGQDFPSNIYFPPVDPNPPELRGRVMWTKSSKTIFDICSEAISRDDAGDPQDPAAYGIFYDPRNAFLFKMVIKKENGNNGYKSSRFIAAVGPHPIVMKKGTNNPDEEAIQKLLDSRHDLYLKIDKPNHEAIKKLTHQMINGGDSGNEITPSTPEDDRPAPPATGSAASSQAARQTQASQTVSSSTSLANEGTTAPPTTSKPKEQEKPKEKPAVVEEKKSAPAATTAPAKPTPTSAGDDDEVDAILAQLRGGEE